MFKLNEQFKTVFFNIIRASVAKKFIFTINQIRKAEQMGKNQTLSTMLKKLYKIDKETSPLDGKYN